MSRDKEVHILREERLAEDPTLLRLHALSLASKDYRISLGTDDDDVTTTAVLARAARFADFIAGTP